MERIVKKLAAALAAIERYARLKKPKTLPEAAHMLAMIEVMAGEAEAEAMVEVMAVKAEFKAAA